MHARPASLRHHRRGRLRSGIAGLRIPARPVFAHVLLADEINRTTPKVQSALLEVMAERQVTVGLRTRVLERPFFVIATQNPVETEGTYALPLAQATVSSAPLHRLS
jgi:MoxR-like ATPase